MGNVSRSALRWPTSATMCRDVGLLRDRVAEPDTSASAAMAVRMMG
jgi:hypothetical protein